MKPVARCSPASRGPWPRARRCRSARSARPPAPPPARRGRRRSGRPRSRSGARRAFSRTRRPSSSFSTSIRSARPSGRRVLHQAPPPVASRSTRSPSCVPFSRKEATAALARCALSGERCRSSNTITNRRPPSLRADGVRRPPGRGAPRPRDRGGRRPWAATGRRSRSRCGRPSSRTVKSVAREAGHGLALAVDHHHVDRDLLDRGREDVGDGRLRRGAARSPRARRPGRQRPAAGARLIPRR